MDVFLIVVIIIVTWTFLTVIVRVEPFACSRERSYGWPYYWKFNNLPSSCHEPHYDYYNCHHNKVIKNVIYLE